MSEASASQTSYKVVLVFSLKPGMADEELRRSAQEDSFPSQLARQHGFVSLELVRVSDDRTMSVQTWRSERDWWAALEAVKQAREGGGEQAESILVSRDFFGGPVVASR